MTIVSCVVSPMDRLQVDSNGLITRCAADFALLKSNAPMARLFIRQMVQVGLIVQILGGSSLV